MSFYFLVINLDVVKYLIGLIESNRYLDSTDFSIIVYLLERPRVASELARKLYLSKQTIYSHTRYLAADPRPIIKIEKKGRLNVYSIV